MDHIHVQEGLSPLLISVPHAGTLIPPEIKERMRPESLFLPDTDWFVDKLYAWAPMEGAGFVTTPWSRYLIDLNRPPDDAPMYDRPGSSLVPLETFEGEPIYRPGAEPDSDETGERMTSYWQPYHDHLARLLNRIRERHGFAVLLDGHSIRSVVPRLFEGELPNLNLGSNAGASASADLIESAWKVLSESGYRAVRDARFKGGYITRHYGRPDVGVHALQLEVAQRTYMPEFPPQWDRARSLSLIELLKQLVGTLQAWRPDLPESGG